MTTEHEPATQSHEGPRSLLRTLKILEYIAAHPEAATLARVSHELQSPKSSLLGLLRALVQHGYLTSEDSRYSLGPSAHRLAIAIVPAFPLSQIAKPIMRDLVAKTGETALLATLDLEMQRAVYVDKVESVSPIRYTVPIGTSRPLYSTAAGRLLLAYQPSEWIDDYLKKLATEPQAGRMTPDSAALRTILAEIRRSGTSQTIGEFSPDVAGVSAAVFDHEHKLIAALTLGAPVERAKKKLSLMMEATHRAALRISSDLGYVNPRNSPSDRRKVSTRAK